MADFIPTRLIDTEPGPLFSQTTVRLVEQVDGSEIQYVALSHCWGRTQLLRLTSDTKPKLLQGIEINSLPTTFQHAITVVRLLGIRYLWIDSLCIVQDSVSDWEIESSLMTNVYGHATVNIAASSASDSRGGLFFDRDAKIVQPFAAYSPGGEYLAPGWYVWTDNGRWAGIADLPLNRRGWVLQERLLSTRTIHFTNSEVFWQCLEDLSSESIPLRIKKDVMTLPLMQIGDYTDIKVAIAKAQFHGLTTEHRERVFKYWWRLLAQYSSCRLTMDSDKLVAIFGIVSYLEKLTGDECLAGLWKSQMPSCLLWTIDWGEGDEAPVRKPSIEDMEALRLRPETWRAPSWSWASHNLPIRFGYHGHNRVCYADVLEASVARTPNGSVISSRLLMRCPVIDVKIDIPQEAGRESIISGWCGGTIISIGEGLATPLYVNTDVAVQFIPQKVHAGLILSGLSSFFFLLFIPFDSLDGNRTIFRRIGTLKVRERSLQMRDNCHTASFTNNNTNMEIKWEGYIKCFEIE